MISIRCDIRRISYDIYMMWCNIIRISWFSFACRRLAMMCETEIRCREQLLYTWTGKQMETYNLSDISDANTAFTLIYFVWKIFRKQIFKIFLTLGPRWSFYCFLNSASDNLTFDSTACTTGHQPKVYNVCCFCCKKTKEERLRLKLLLRSKVFSF